MKAAPEFHHRLTRFIRGDWSVSRFLRMEYRFLSRYSGPHLIPATPDVKGQNRIRHRDGEVPC
jgi:hypothetical protein